MELDPSQGARASEPSSLDSLQDFAASFLRYLELRLQLLGLESRETGIHLLILALLFVKSNWRCYEALKMSKLENYVIRAGKRYVP